MKKAVSKGSLPHEIPSVPHDLDPPTPGDPAEGHPDHPWFAPHRDALDTLERCFHMRRSWDLKLMEAIASLEDLGTYKEMGFESVADFLCAHLGIGYMRTTELVEVALALPRLPLIKEAYRQGKLSYDHLRALVQVAGPETEEDLLRESDGLSVGQVFRLVRRIKEVSKEESLDSRAYRFLEMRWDHDQRMLHIQGQLPEDQGARFEKVIDTLAKDIPEDPTWEWGPTPMAMKRADALVELAEASLRNDFPSTQVVVHVEAGVLLSGEGAGEIEGGPTVSPETVRRLCCDASLLKVAHNQDGKPIGFGRLKRTVPKRTKQELLRRDRTCRWPSCRRSRRMDAHHIEHWLFDGETEWDNLVLLCEFHHYLVHEGGYRVIGIPPKITIIPASPHLPPLRAGPPPMLEEVRILFEEEARARSPANV